MKASCAPGSGTAAPFMPARRKVQVSLGSCTRAASSGIVSRMKVLLKLVLAGASAFGSLAAQPPSVQDSRIEGVWKLSSERADGGPVAPLAAGSVMTVARIGDHVRIRITDEGGKVVPAIPDGGPAKIQSHFSPDAKTLTQTTSGADSHNGRPYRVTRVWQKQFLSVRSQ
jgi:hypothetical protein